MHIDDTNCGTPQDSVSTDSESESPEESLDATPNKLNIVKEIFGDINDEQIMCFLNLLDGNVHKVISVCLEGLTVQTILRVFKSVKTTTKMKKIAVHKDSLVQDALR